MENKASVQMRPCGSEKNGEWAYVGNGVKVQFCSLHNVSTNQQNHRRSLSSEERQSYLKAVQFLHELPPKLKKYFPAVHSRYDDFVFFMSLYTAFSCSNIRCRLPTI